MDYIKLSDSEINKEVAKQFPNRFLFNGDGDPYELVNSDIPAYSGSDFDEAPFEPCNNPSDAWAIITENRIMINPYCADELWKCEAMCSSDGFMTTYATAYDKNPLRAAMIAFLMMKEKENARDN